eukprot:357584-Chlamydomonas_euryale.AAC.6
MRSSPPRKGPGKGGLRSATLPNAQPLCTPAMPHDRPSSDAARSSTVRASKRPLGEARDGVIAGVRPWMLRALGPTWRWRPVRPGRSAVVPRDDAEQRMAEQRQRVGAAWTHSAG